MKLWILSDIHLEHSGLAGLEPPDADICVVAGDIQNKGLVASLQWLDQHIAKHMPVIFVGGNHEFYKADHGFMDEILRAQSYEGSGRVHFLENSTIQFGDLAFIGATLWTDFALFGQEWSEIAARNASTAITDYRVIKFERNPYQALRPVHTYRKHVRSRDVLERSIYANFHKKIVILTHHAPSIRSVEERYAEDLLTASFASNLEPLMREGGPVLWVHGHVHHRVDYQLNNTRVVANPRGYPGEKCYEDYDFKFVVEV